jgi:hypothetical protein
MIVTIMQGLNMMNDISGTEIDVTPFQGWGIVGLKPRALPWAGMYSPFRAKKYEVPYDEQIQPIPRKKMEITRNPQPATRNPTPGRLQCPKF